MYTKLCCDEEEILLHATELLKELGPACSMADAQEGEGEDGGCHMTDVLEKEEGVGSSRESVREDSSSEDGMDIT